MKKPEKNISVNQRYYQRKSASMINPKEVYTTKEAREFLKVSESTIKRLLKGGIIKAYKVGRTYRIWGDEILGLVSPKFERKVYKAYKKAREKTKKTIERW